MGTERDPGPEALCSEETGWEAAQRPSEPMGRGQRSWGSLKRHSVPCPPISWQWLWVRGGKFIRGFTPG